MNASYDPKNVLEGYRQATQHTAGTVNASLDETVGRISAGEQIPMPPPAPTTEIGLGLKLVAGLGVAGAIALGAFVAFDRDATPEKPPTPVALQVQATATESPTERPPAPPPLQEEEPGSVPRPAASADPPAREHLAERSKPGQSTGAGLDEEIKLMGDARRALGAGDPAGALRTLERHHKRFPKGQLQGDRDRSMVTALCQLGRTDEALRVAERTGTPVSSCAQGDTP